MAIEFSEVLSTFKSRVRNPFFGSFILSWLIINWRVSLGIWVIDKADLDSLGYDNLIEYIDCKVNLWNGFGLPFIIGGVIAGITPFIIAGYKIIKSRAEDWYTKDQKKDADKRHIRMEKYLELWEIYGKKLDQLNKAINDAEIFKKERIDLESDLDKANEKTKSLETSNRTLISERDRRDEKIQELQNSLGWLNDINSYPGWLDGKALMRIKMNGEKTETWVRISGGKILSINEKGDNLEFLQFQYTKVISEQARVIVVIVDASDRSNKPVNLWAVLDVTRNVNNPKGCTGSITNSMGTGNLELIQEWE